MAMDASEIERLILSGIPDAQVTIRDHYFRIHELQTLLTTIRYPYVTTMVI